MKYLKEYQEYRVEDTNEFFNFRSKEDSKFIDELIDRIRKKENRIRIVEKKEYGTP
mgnify:CR=1 FL=1